MGVGVGVGVGATFDLIQILFFPFWMHLSVSVPTLFVTPTLLHEAPAFGFAAQVI